MGITSMQIKRSTELGFDKEVSLSLKEVPTTETKTAAIPASYGKSGATGANAGTASTGTGSTDPVGPPGPPGPADPAAQSRAPAPSSTTWHRRLAWSEGGEPVDYITIAVPDMNDSFSRVVLNGTAYLMRFTWNDTAQRWMGALHHRPDRHHRGGQGGAELPHQFAIRPPGAPGGGLRCHLRAGGRRAARLPERKRPVRVHGSTAVAFSAGISVEKTLEKNAEKAPETSGENPV